ncbi:MAG: alpha/beta hydrolase [Roseivirga sp.]|nr:alpha/beta hydrolase [Roseivirga sp.]
MNKKLYKYYLGFALIFLLAFSACGDDDAGTTSIAPFSILNETTLVLNGVIDSNTDSAFDEALRQNPNTELIIFREAPGSDDDDTNLQVGRKLFQLGLRTQVEDNGLIASGAVDLFLAGSQRTLGANARVGVHSWSDGTSDATDFPRSSSEHLLYIDYYKSIGFSNQLAEDFYFFTINAAPADDIHWMTEAEIVTYQIEK